MNNKELQIKAEKYIEENGIDKNTYAIEKAFRDGAKMILNLGQELPIHNVSKSFEKLIDRLEKASDIKYPNRPYTPEFRKSVALMWKHKEDELLRQVEKLEKEVNVA